ncbi:MAG: MarR family transcriptional regulator [Negativicutes bacterium]|nr:MarR family transcriptional regulator [Negativicutes bacterium]
MTKVIEQYLRENIDDRVRISPWKDKEKFPIFLRNIYLFHEMTILDTSCVLLEIIEEAPGVDMIQKQIKRIEELSNQQPVLYYKEITAYRRRSLIENRIPFVIENGQMYLPFLGLDLSRTPQNRDGVKKILNFSTSVQVAYLFFLYHKDTVLNTLTFAEKMGITGMTASRILNDLHNVKLITYEIAGMTGRSKEYRRIPDPEYFEIGRSYIKSPVKKVVYVKRAPENTLVAGLEALAELSMMNPPGHLVRAISRKQFDKEELEIITNSDIIKDENLVELEIWDYNPKQFTESKYVDMLSLYASLKDDKDERVEQALDEVLRGEPWYTG